MGQGMIRSLVQIIYFFAFTIFSVHGTIFVISEETNETVRVIYEKNIRAVSDAVEGYVVISNPLNACEPVEPAPSRKNVARAIGNFSTEEPAYVFEDEGRVEREWVLLSIVYDCDVTTKARNAQLGGYKALIIQNIGSNDSQHIPWHILRFPLVKLNHVIVGEYDGDLLRSNFSYPNNKYYVKFEEDKFYQLMCYILIGIIIVLLSTMFALFWFQICCAIIIVVPHQIRQLLQRWLHPGKRRLTRPMLQLIPVKDWSSTDPFQACAICQEDFKENDKLRVLPCLHGFHAMCVDPWLLRRRCPCCMQTIKMANDEEDDDNDNENEDTYITSQLQTSYARSSPDAENPDRERIQSTGLPTEGLSSPLLEEMTQSPTRFHSALSNPKSDTSPESCTITSPSESRKSSQEVKTSDWQLRRFLQNFHYIPSSSEMSSISCNGDAKLKRKSQKAPSQNNHTNNLIPVAVAPVHTSIEITNLKNYKATKLLETNLDSSQSCSTDMRNSTLEVQVGTLGTEDVSYHLSSPYPASSNTFTMTSTTRDRKTSDATTISGSLPRDESSFHNIADEIHSEIISEEVFLDEQGDSSVSAHCYHEDSAAHADKD